MDAQVALREIAATTSHLIDLPQSARNRLDARTDAIAIGFCPDQLNADPMVPTPGLPAPAGTASRATH
jgi:hypothetical protein